MLLRRDIYEAARASLMAEGVHCAVSPLLGGQEGLPAYRGFLERMKAIIQQTPVVEEGDASNTIAARAPQKPVESIINDPETRRRLAAIERGEKP